LQTGKNGYKKYFVFHTQVGTKNREGGIRRAVYTMKLAPPFNSLPSTPPPEKVASISHFVLNTFYLKIAL
jgi:hypothetical protein